jgi:hypothetical protein
VAQRQGLGDSVAQFNWTVPPLVSEAVSRPVLLSNRPLEAPLTAAAAIAAVVIMLLAVGAWVAGRRPIRPPAPAEVPGEPSESRALEEAT